MKITYTTGFPAVPAQSPVDMPVLVTAVAPTPPPHLIRRPLCLVALVDVSGSMIGAPLDGVKQALECLEQQLVPGDHLAVVTFSSSAQLLLPMAEVSASNRAQLRASIRSMRTGGLTNMVAGLDLAIEQLATLPAELMGRVILLSDGHPNRGRATDRESLCALVKRDFGRHGLSCFGYSTHCDQELMEELSDTGRGSYAFLDSEDATLDAFAQELGGLLSTYAMDTCIELQQDGQEAQRDQLGQVLFGGEASLLVNVRHPGLPVGSAAELGKITVTFRDPDGRAQTVEAPLRVDVVKEADMQRMHPEVQRSVDERTLAEAQARAEKLAEAGDFEGAMALLARVADTLQTSTLREKVKQDLVHEYAAPRFQDSSGLRKMLKRRLKNKRMLSATSDLDGLYGPMPALSREEQRLVEAFRKDRRKGSPEA